MNHKEKNVDFAKNSLTILVKIDKNICLDTKKIKQMHISDKRSPFPASAV